VNLTSESLARLRTDFAGYLEGEKLTGFFRAYEIKMSAGHWAAGEFVDRFCPVGYNSDKANFDNSIFAQIGRVREAGLDGIEFHDTVFYKDGILGGGVDEKLIREVKDALSEAGLVATVMNLNLWTNPKYKLGGLCNPKAAVRREAIEQCKLGAEVAKQVGCFAVNLWPGSDGWDYNFEYNYGTILDYFVEGCVEVNKHCASLGLVFGTEPKHHEPREQNMIINTVAKAALVAQKVNALSGNSNMGVVIDYGHEQQYSNEPADSLYLLDRMGVPIRNFHVNNAKPHSNDEDRIAGTGDIWRMCDFCYAALDLNYSGWFGQDQFTYRSDQVEAMRLSREFFGNIMKKAMVIYADREALLRAQASGVQTDAINVVKKTILG